MVKAERGTEIKTGKDIYGRDFSFIPCGLVKGRNKLLAVGFSPCQNPLYYKKGNEYWHYNKLSGIWYHVIDNGQTTIA